MVHACNCSTWEAVRQEDCHEAVLYRESTNSARKEEKITIPIVYFTIPQNIFFLLCESLFSLDSLETIKLGRPGQKHYVSPSSHSLTVRTHTVNQDFWGRGTSHSQATHYLKWLWLLREEKTVNFRRWMSANSLPTSAESSQTSAQPCGYPRFSQLSCSSVLSNHLCTELRGCKTAVWQHDLHGDLETKAVFAFIVGKIH